MECVAFSIWSSGNGAFPQGESRAERGQQIDWPFLVKGGVCVEGWTCGSISEHSGTRKLGGEKKVIQTLAVNLDLHQQTI